MTEPKLPELNSTYKPPNPGSDEAIKLGCSCPVLDNAHGWGYWKQGIFVIDMLCEMHNKAAMNIMRTDEDTPTAHPAMCKCSQTQCGYLHSDGEQI